MTSSFYKPLTGLQLDYSMRLPDNIIDLPEGEHEHVKQPHRSLVSYNEKEFFIRSVLPIEIIGTNDYLKFGVWTQVEEETYRKCYAAWITSKRQDVVVEGLMFGVLGNTFPATLYPETFNLHAMILDRPVKAAQCLLEENKHPLSLEQHNGITLERAREISRIMTGRQG